MSDVKRKLPSSRHQQYEYSRLNGRCESANGSRYYSCDETDSSLSNSDDDNRKRSETLFHSLSWEFVPPVNVETNPSTALLQGSHDAGHTRSEDYGHSTLSNETFVDPISTLSKCIFLLCLCLIPMGDYFCVDNPVALHDHILKDIDINESQYSRFYSNAQWAIIGSSFLGGFLIDRIIRIRVGIILFTTILTISQAIFAGGAYMDSYWTMFAARLLYGIARGPLGIIVDKLDIKWFKPGNLNTVFGLEKSIGHISNFVIIHTMSVIYDGLSTYKQSYECLGLTLFTGVGFCLVTLVSSMFVAGMDKRADRLRNIVRIVPVEDEIIPVFGIKEFPLSYWLIVLTATVYHIGVFLFVGLGKIYLERKYDLNSQYAGTLNGMVCLLPALTLPMFGILIDRLGRSISWMFIGLMLSLISHLLLTFSFLHPSVAMVTLGLGYSILTATIWPMVAYVIEFKHTGTAYGIMIALLCSGQAGVVYLTDYIVDVHGYFVVEIFFNACMFVAIFLGIVLVYADYSEDGCLNLKASERKKYW